MTKKVTKFDYRTIKSFEDACKHLKIDTKFLKKTKIINMPKGLEEFIKPMAAVYRLMVIFKAINNGWQPDWSKPSQNKYYPWFGVLSSGFGFSSSAYYYADTTTCVGSRLCTDTSEKALYIAETFEAEYKEFLLYSK